jgi:hypothetical protein
VCGGEEALACVVNDADRASDVVGRIGSLIKKALPRKEVVDLNAAILEVTALTRSEAVKTSVTVGTQLAGESPLVGVLVAVRDTGHGLRPEKPAAAL